MARFRRLLAVACAVSGLAGILSPSPARATSFVAGGGVVTGSGTISPGLTITPTYQNWTFTGRVTGEATIASVAPSTSGSLAFDAPCNFSGSSSNFGETILTGSGTLVGNCTTTASAYVGTVAGRPVAEAFKTTAICALVYDRNAALLFTFTGLCTAALESATVPRWIIEFCIAGEFHFLPTTLWLPHMTSYLVAGDITVSPRPQKLPCVPSP